MAEVVEVEGRAVEAGTVVEQAAEQAVAPVVVRVVPAAARVVRVVRACQVAATQVAEGAVRVAVRGERAVAVVPPP
jgi:hypothetical protein